jgi:hypothetical protein
MPRRPHNAKMLCTYARTYMRRRRRFVTASPRYPAAVDTKAILLNMRPPATPLHA